MGWQVLSHRVRSGACPALSTSFLRTTKRHDLEIVRTGFETTTTEFAIFVNFVNSKPKTKRLANPEQVMAWPGTDRFKDLAAQAPFFFEHIGY